MKKVIICRGIPASGKSTWAKQFIKENKNWIRIGRDDFRHMLNSYAWDYKVEEVITP